MRLKEARGVSPAVYALNFAPTEYMLDTTNIQSPCAQETTGVSALGVKKMISSA
jgi:hypothetical protein